MHDSGVLIGLRVAIRDNQDMGKLPCETEASRRFQVMVSEVAVPVLRELVNLFCLEGITAHLLMAMDEATPYVAIKVDRPDTTLWVYPSATASEVMTSVRGGLYQDYTCDRTLQYRGLTPDILETVLVEQLRLILCPAQPIL